MSTNESDVPPVPTPPSAEPASESAAAEGASASQTPPAAPEPPAVPESPAAPEAPAAPQQVADVPPVETAASAPAYGPAAGAADAPAPPVAAPAAPAAQPAAPAAPQQPLSAAELHAAQAYPAQQTQQPYAQQTYAGQPQYGAQQPYGYQTGPVLPKGLSLTAMITGIAGVFLSFFAFGFLPALAGVIFGHIGQKREPHAKPFWLTGIITGYVGLAISILWFLLFLIPLLFLLPVGMMGGF